MHDDRDAADALEDRLAQQLAIGFATKVDRRGRALDADERTTALAFTAAFLLPARPVLAGLFAEHAIARCERAIGAACHEWDPRDGRAHADDAASGPTIEGFSTGATALAMVAARAGRDPAMADVLLATAMLLGADKLPARSLEAALVAWAGVARAW